MECRIGNKKIRIYPQYLEQISSGYEGITYKYCGKVLKLYYDRPKKDVLSFQDCEYMTKFNTERLLLPDKAVCDKKHIMKGYVISPYIEPETELNIYEVPGSMFLKERELIQLELNYLGENFISVDDFCMDNFCCSDKFYFWDPGSYKVHWNMMDNDIERNIIYLANLNLEYFDNFLYTEIILRYMKNYISNTKVYEQVFRELHARYSEINFYSKMDYVSQFIIPDISLEESIKQIVKSHKS